MPVSLDRLDLLYPVLARLPQELRERLARESTEVAVPPGAAVFDERQPCQGFVFVLQGAIRVLKRSAAGRELLLYRVSAGESCIVTASCLLADRPYNACGQSEGESVLVLVPRNTFFALFAFEPFRNFVFGLFAERIADLMQLVEEVAFRKLDQRLAALLLGKGRVVHATHQQLADELGSVREIVSRLLKGFASEGMVALGREQIEILDAAALRRVAGEGR